MKSKTISINDVKEIMEKMKKTESKLFNSIDNINYFYNSFVYLSKYDNPAADCCLICLDDHKNYNHNYDHEKLNGFYIYDYYEENTDNPFLRIDGAGDNTNINIHFSRKDGLLFYIGWDRYTVKELLSKNDKSQFQATKNKAKTMLYNGIFFTLVLNRIYDLTENKLKDDTINLDYVQKINNSVDKMRKMLGDFKK